MPQYAIELKGITKTFGSVVANKNIELHLLVRRQHIRSKKRRATKWQYDVGCGTSSRRCSLPELDGNYPWNINNL